jgi:hypothetical protein
MADKKPLEPLIPMDDLKAVLTKIVAAPKARDANLPTSEPSAKRSRKQPPT